MLTDEQLINLPEEPELAFVEFESLMRATTQVLISEVPRGDSGNEYRLEYINKVLAAAKAYEIDALKDWDVPRDEGDVYSDYRNFLADVDHYIVQIRIRNAARTKKFSVELDSQSKAKIHHFVSQIKTVIDQASLEVLKKNQLFDKLNEFSSEVDRNRTRWQSGMALYVSVCSAIGEGVEKLEPARKWLDSIAQVLGQQKEQEEKLMQLPSPAERKKLSPPRKQLPPPAKGEMDDEIPF